MSFEKVYSKLPIWAQHTAVSAYGLYWGWLRFGGTYSAAVEEYRSRGQFSFVEWQRLQQQQLAELLTAAVSHVPYYRDTWTRSEKAAARTGNLDALPLLTKDAVRTNPSAFLREDIRQGLKRFHTSGSTGTPITTIWTVDEVRRSRAVREARSNEWAGVSYGLPRATFSGRMVEPRPDSAGPYYRFNVIERQVYFSPFHLRPETAELYVRALHRHRTRWLSGYAVSFFTLARYIIEQNLPRPAIDAVITTSEKLTPIMRSTIQEAFGARVFEEYGTVENIMLATECESGKLHISPDVGVVEILREDGTACSPGEVGEVVATGLMRTAQPFIRYRLGDLASWDDAICGCGRHMPIIKEVVGRLEDVVVGPDGRELVRFHGIFVNQPNIREGQIIQESLDQIRVKVVPTPSFSASDVDDITHRVRNRLGAGVYVTVDQVEDIPRTASGKFKAVISHVSSPSS